MLLLRVKKKRVTNRGEVTTETLYEDNSPVPLLLLPLLKSGYVYEYTFDVLNDPHSINHGVNYEDLRYKLVAYDANSEAAYDVGDVYFLLGEDVLELDEEYPITIPKGGAEEFKLVVAVTTAINDDYDEGMLNYGLEVVHPLDMSGHDAIFGRGVFGITAFSEPKELSGISRGLKSVVGYGEKLMFNVFSMSIETEELYEEYIELED